MWVVKRNTVTVLIKVKSSIFMHLVMFFSLLWWWCFFYHNTRHRIQSTRVTITKFMTTVALAYPKSSTYKTFRNLLTVAFYMAMTMRVAVCINVNHSFNSCRLFTFFTIKCEIPSIANTAAIGTQSPFIEDTE